MQMALCKLETKGTQPLGEAFGSWTVSVVCFQQESFLTQCHYPLVQQCTRTNLIHWGKSEMDFIKFISS